ncbi:MAG: hypothetical protein M3Z95_08680 [Actinomycetota bacterium]|nr:hypothetical protein [Actinomycetota bacterium]
MAVANVNLVRTIVAAWERGDWRTADWADPEIEFVLREVGPRTAAGRGSPGWRRASVTT